MEETKTKFYKKKWFIILVVLVIIIAVFSATGSSDTSTNEGTDENVAEVEETTTEEETEDDGIYSVGEVATYNDVEYSVTSFEKSQGDDFDVPAEGKEYVIVTLQITNNSDDTVSYDPYDYTMQNSEGQITDTAMTIIDSDTTLEYGDLAPGGNVSGTIVFEQPIDDSDLQLILTPNLLSNDELRFEIK